MSLGSHGSGLDVVAAQEALQVEDGECITLIERQELAQSDVSLDRLLVHQVVGAGIGHHTLRHLRAAHLRILGHAEERAELIRDLHGLGEDAVGRGSTLRGRGLALALTLSLLDHASRLLLNRLEGGSSGRDLGLELAEHRLQGVQGVRERLGDIHLLLGRSGGLSDSRHRGSDGNGGNRLSSLGLLGHLGGGSGHGGGNGNRGLNGLRDGLLGRLGSGGAHRTVVRGSVGRHLTR